MSVTQVAHSPVYVRPVEIDSWRHGDPVPQGGIRLPTADAVAAAVASPCAHTASEVSPSTFAAASPGGDAARHEPSGPQPSGSLPRVDPKEHPRLAAFYMHLQLQLSSSSSIAYNGKTHLSALNECVMQRRIQLEAKERIHGGMFVCELELVDPRSGVIRSQGSAASKKNAKQAAATACLEALLAQGALSDADLTNMLTSITPTAAASVTTGAAAAAAAVTDTALAAGDFPRCAALMAEVHRAPGGQLKTVLMVLNEYAAKTRGKADLAEVSSNALAGPFCFTGTFTDGKGELLAQAKGQEYNTKQEAKQGGAAALLEALLEAGKLDQRLAMPGGKAQKGRVA